MSTTTSDRQSPGEAVAGVLAASALFIGLMAVAYRPARLAPFAALLVLLATGMGARRHGRLIVGAVVAVSVGFMVGMTVAVITSNPLY